MHILSMGVIADVGLCLGAVYCHLLDWRWIFYVSRRFLFWLDRYLFYLSRTENKNVHTKTRFVRYLAVYWQCLEQQKITFYLLAKRFFFEVVCLAYIAASAFVYIFFGLFETAYAGWCFLYIAVW